MGRTIDGADASGKQSVRGQQACARGRLWDVLAELGTTNDRSRWRGSAHASGRAPAHGKGIPTMGGAKINPASAPTPLGERRQVSVLFADVVGFTAIAERLGEEKTFAFVRLIYDMLTGAVLEQGGSVRGFAGDSIMALFGVPEAQEDAALRACRTALSIHAAFAAAADEIESSRFSRPGAAFSCSRTPASPRRGRNARAPCAP